MDRAHAEYYVEEIAMEPGADVVSEVKGDGGENAEWERANKWREAEVLYHRGHCQEDQVEKNKCFGGSEGVRGWENISIEYEEKKEKYSLLPWCAIF